MTTNYTPRFVDRPLHTRTVVNRAVDWIAGEFPSAKAAMDYRMVRYDGLLSRDFILNLEDDPSVVSYWEKPNAFRWSNGVRWRKYTPDYAVDLDDGRTICVEVMPLSRVAKSRFLDRLPFNRRFAIRTGYADFELWTEQEVTIQPKLANAELVGSERSFVTDEAQTHRMRVLVRERDGRASIRDLRRESGLGRQSFRAIIRLIANGELRAVNPNVPLDDNAVVEIPNC